MPSLAQVVKRARLAKELSQEELAELLGVSKGWVGQVETGKIARPRPEYQELLERHLGISREDLARAMNMLGPAVDLDILAEIRRIASIADVEVRADELRQLPPEVFEVIESLALDMVRQTFQQAREVVRPSGGSGQDSQVT